jgi:protein gp37
MKNSHIEWTDHTFNPWEGCTKVSPGCAHCYAETRNVRFSAGRNWGPGAPRRRTSPANWHQPVTWNRAAEGSRLPPRVFSASLADWLDDEISPQWLADFLTLIHYTPHLDWLLLTKRPQNWRSRLEATGGCDFDSDFSNPSGMIGEWLRGRAPENVWIGTTVEDQTRADQRIPELMKIPAVVRFLSCEPLLGPLDLYNGDPDPRLGGHTATRTYLGDWWEPGDNPRGPSRHGVDWVICGGESGHGARVMNPDWARSLRDQCAAAEVSFFFKQWGKQAPGRELDGEIHSEFPTPRGR